VDIAVCASAVADFKVNKIKKNKLKKINSNYLTLNLEKNVDILEFLGKNNKFRPKLIVGFSAETENVIENSKNKLKNKHCDIIIANDVSKKNSGFNVDYNKVTIIKKSGKIESIPRNKKSFIANLLAKKIVDKLLIDEKNIN
jgi:phosphopantothenoylcysteine decarboxylase/phosphopantothenate--cysteine ligase